MENLQELNQRMKDLVKAQSWFEKDSKEWKLLEETLTYTANKIYSLKFAGIQE